MRGIDLLLLLGLGILNEEGRDLGHPAPLHFPGLYRHCEEHANRAIALEHSDMPIPLPLPIGKGRRRFGVGAISQ